MAGRDMEYNFDHPMNYSKNTYANNCKKMAQNTEPWAENFYNDASTSDSEMQISNILQNLTLDEISLLNQHNQKIVQEKLLRDHESLNIKHTLMNLHKGLQSEAIKKQQNLNQAKEGFYSPFGNIQNYGEAMDLSKNKRNVDDHGTDQKKIFYEMDTSDEVEHRYYNCDNIGAQDVSSLETLFDKNNMISKRNPVLGSNINVVEDDSSRTNFGCETNFVDSISSGFNDKGN